MTVADFYMQVAASLVGNALTVLVIYFLWRAAKAEKRGLTAAQLPFGLVVAAIIPFGIVAWAALSLT